MGLLIKIDIIIIYTNINIMYKMPLTFRLIGTTLNGKFLQITQNLEGAINIEYINNMFKTLEFSDSEVSNIRFITESEQIKNDEKTFIITNEEERIIHVFSSDIEIRAKLQQTFIKHGTEVEHRQHRQMQNDESKPDPEISMPLQQKQDTLPVMTPEIISKMNTEAIKLLEDPDFMTIAEIVVRNPDILNKFSKYTQKGTFVVEPQQQVELSQEQLENFKELASKIKLNIPDELKVNMLIKHNGHLNLAIRDIISEMVSAK
jgi:hypothetical protein